MEAEEKYRAYVILKKMDREAAFQFLLENENDRRFMTMVRVADAFLQYLKEFLDQTGGILDDRIFDYLEKRLKEDYET